eukprot:1136163-Pelagomonas_calceolata.AAC.2
MGTAVALHVLLLVPVTAPLIDFSSGKLPFLLLLSFLYGWTSVGASYRPSRGWASCALKLVTPRLMSFNFSRLLEYEHSQWSLASGQFQGKQCD